MQHQTGFLLEYLALEARRVFLGDGDGWQRLEAVQVLGAPFRDQECPTRALGMAWGGSEGSRQGLELQSCGWWLLERVQPL